MSKGNTTENDIVKYILQNVAPSWDAATTLYVALHTADPGEGGDQTSNEAAFTSYARVAIARASGAGGWTVTGNQGSNTSEVTFPECTGAPEVETHASVGLAASGPSQILYKGPLTATISVDNLITIRFPAGTLVLQED